MIQNIEKRMGARGGSLALLLVAVLAPLTAAQADTWHFKLVKSPAALNKNSPGGESIRVSGGGTFDVEQGVVAASGTYTISNAFDHPNGPIVHGTWHSTGFVSFTPEGKPHHDRQKGVLTINIEEEDQTGGGVGTGTMTVMDDGIEGPIYAGEPYIVPPNGSGGGARFYRDDDETFFPPPF